MQTRERTARILLLITDLEIGGTPTVVRELAWRLRAVGGAHVEVACLAKWGPVADELAARAVPVTALGAGGALQFPQTIARLARLVGLQHFDTVFSFLLHANMVAALTRPLTRCPRWLQSIQTSQPNPRWHWHAQALAQFGAEQIVAPSRSVAEVAAHRSGIPIDKITVIPNAVDPADFVLGSADSSRPIRRIGFIGRLDPIKRIDDLVSAMSLLDASYTLHIYGEGDERGRIVETIFAHNLANRVTLHGAIRRPQAALAEIDLLVLPSEAEGFGLVLIEAMAAGIPLVATNVPGIRDVARDGQTALLVPVASPPAIANAITRLATDPALRKALIDEAKVDVACRFSWEQVLPQYQRLLGIGGRGDGLSNS